MRRCSAAFPSLLAIGEKLNGKAEKTGIREQVLNEIIDFAEKYDVKKVVLFGSRARGDFKRTSDIDLAVYGGNFDRFALDVNEETSTLCSLILLMQIEKCSRNCGNQ